MQKSLLLTAQPRSSDLVISEMAKISVLESADSAAAFIILDSWWGLVSEAPTSCFPLFDPQNKEYLYDTIKLGSYGPYLREQTAEIFQACNALSGTSVLCTITGVRPVEKSNLGWDVTVGSFEQRNQLQYGYSDLSTFGNIVPLSGREPYLSDLFTDISNHYTVAFAETLAVTGTFTRVDNGKSIIISDETYGMTEELFFSPDDVGKTIRVYYEPL